MGAVGPSHNRAATHAENATTATTATTRHAGALEPAQLDWDLHARLAPEPAGSTRRKGAMAHRLLKAKVP